MDFKLAGRVALVTGSSKGIGGAIANALCDEGAAVIVHGRDPVAVSAMADRLRAKGGIAHELVGDVSGEFAVSDMVARAQALAGHIDILVNNAGGSSPDTESWAGTQTQTWQSTFNRNVLAAVTFSKLLVPAMRAARWGRIVNIASGAAVMPPATNPDYSAAKAALLAMTASLSKAVASDGVTVNALSPGTIHSEKLDGKFRELAARHAAIRQDAPWAEVEAAVLPIVGGVPVGRVGTLDEIASTAAFLCSANAGYITGVNLRVDGGMFSGI